MSTQMDAIAIDPRAGKTTARTRTVSKGTPGAYVTDRGTRWEITYAMTPYQEVAATVVEILAGRPVADAVRADALVADFDGTAEISEAHALFVAAVHNIAIDHPYPTGRLVTWAVDWPVHEAFEAVFPRTAPATPQQGTCSHGVSYLDDCVECGE